MKDKMAGTSLQVKGEIVPQNNNHNNDHNDCTIKTSKNVNDCNRKTTLQVKGEVVPENLYKMETAKITTTTTTLTTILLLKDKIGGTSLQVKGEVVPENRAEIESSIRKSLDTVVASDSVEVKMQQTKCKKSMQQLPYDGAQLNSQNGLDFTRPCGQALYVYKVIYCYLI